MQSNQRQKERHNLEIVLGNFKCGVCFETKIEGLYNMPCCSQNYCGHCLRTWDSCPTKCSHQRFTHPDSPAASRVLFGPWEEVSACCPMIACGWRGTCGTYIRKHEKVCEHIHRPCPNYGCHFSGTHAELDAHKGKCKNHPCENRGCDMRGSLAHIRWHLEHECKEHPCCCLGLGCSEKVTYSQLQRGCPANNLSRRFQRFLKKNFEGISALPKDVALDIFQEELLKAGITTLNQSYSPTSP